MAEPPWLPLCSFFGSLSFTQNDPVGFPFRSHAEIFFLGEGGSRASLVASWFLGEERSGKCEDADEEERRMATFLGEVLGLVVLSGVGAFYLKRARMSTK